MITKDDLNFYRKPYRVLVKGDHYIYSLPHPKLRGWISNYTITFPYKGLLTDHYTVIPHGCATLVFSCDKSGISSRLFGPAAKPSVVGQQANQTNMLFIIEFQPAGLYAFTGVQQKELTDRIIPFTSINSHLNRLITESIEKARSTYELVISVDNLLMSAFKTASPPELDFSVQNIVENTGNISVKELSASVYYSERHLNRMFAHYLGMNAKTFSRLVRINTAIRLLHYPQNSITNACNLSGFYDLPHFIHDFKSVCGLTPQEYRHKMSDFYSEINKF